MATQKLALYEDQLAILDQLREGFRQQHQCQLLYAPTGAGKTEIAMALMHATAQKEKRAAMALDRLVLVDQTSKRLDKYGIDHGVMQAGHWRYRPAQRIQVCSAQTVETRGLPDMQLLIIDECFPGDTLVSTPSGDVRIDKIKDGDRVHNGIYAGVVKSIFTKRVARTLTVRLSDGTRIEATEDHPFFTPLGWRPARALAVGTQLFRREAVRTLWGADQACFDPVSQRGRDSRFGSGFHQAAVLRQLLREEVGQSDGFQCLQGEDEGYSESHWTQAASSWREWPRTHVDRVLAAGEAAEWMDWRIRDAYIQEAGARLPTSLQARLGVAFQDALHRIGWRQSRHADAPSAGRQEGRAAALPWVESVEAVEHPGGREVFNLRVGGHPSYFANGVLVHNCHDIRKKIIAFLKANPQVRGIGLSASPFTKGLGATYTRVVSATTTDKLVQAGRLVPLKVYIAKQINMKGAKKVAGEFSSDAASERGMKITGDVVSEWTKMTMLEFKRPVKTVVFCSNVAHGTDLAQKFAESGFNFVAISYLTDDDFKREAIAEFAKPDSKINGLIACDILTKGFDVPDVLIGVSARPFAKSFSSHVQQMGRVMRAASGKAYALWLDHSGNYLRFQEDWDELYYDGVSELKDEDKKAPKELTDKEVEERRCPKCSALWPSKSDTCPQCGHVRVRLNLIEHVEGEMVELTPSADRATKQAWWSQILAYSEGKGWSRGAASHKYREKFGVWPRGLNDTPMPMTPEVAGWLKSRQIAWARSKAKAFKGSSF